MVTLVEAPWLEERLDSPGILVLDPRRPMKYLQGHLKGAINLPLAKIFGPPIGKGGRTPLLPDAELAGVFGGAGLDGATTPVLYDSCDGQAAAMLSWALEYLGRDDVKLLNIFYEAWVTEGREVFYRPVKAQPRRFIATVNRGLRASLEDVGASLPSPPRGGEIQRGVKLLDLRSEAEYLGGEDTGVRPGHIPGAINIPWKQLVGGEMRPLDSQGGLERRLAAAGVRRGDRVITYCRMGPRAAIGYLALRQLGYQVRLFDGSYAEWSAAGMPVEGVQT